MGSTCLRPCWGRPAHDTRGSSGSLSPTGGAAPAAELQRGRGVVVFRSPARIGRIDARGFLRSPPCPGSQWGRLPHLRRGGAALRGGSDVLGWRVPHFPPTACADRIRYGPLGEFVCGLPKRGPRWTPKRSSPDSQEGSFAGHVSITFDGGTALAGRARRRRRTSSLPMLRQLAWAGGSPAGSRRS